MYWYEYIPVYTGVYPAIPVHTRLSNHYPDIAAHYERIRRRGSWGMGGCPGARISPNQRRDLFRHGISINIGDLRPGLGLSMTGSSSVTSVTGNYIGK